MALDLHSQRSLGSLERSGGGRELIAGGKEGKAGWKRSSRYRSLT